MSGAATEAPRASEVTVVCCVESGPLEHQTVRLAESIRRWGGWFSAVRILAVTPRFGPRLRPETHRAFDRHGVEHVRFRARAPYLWQHYMNKPLAITAAVERASTPLVAWLDSDIVVVGEPTGLLPGPDEDFVACARDRGGIGSSGPGDPRDAYWAHVCRVAGLDLDHLPWVHTEEEGDRIRMYWNSGVFVLRASSGMAEDYLDLNVALLDARVGTASNRHQYNDQVALGLSVVRRGLRWRQLDHSLNYGVSRWHPDDPDELATARIVHYHDSLEPDFFPELVRRLEARHPEVGAWMRALGPLVGDPPLNRVARQALRAARSVRRRGYYRRCTWL